MFKRIAAAVVCFLLLSVPCRALELGEQAQAYGTDTLDAALPEEAGELLGPLTTADCLRSEGLLQRLAAALGERVREALRETAGTAAAIVGIVLLTSLADSVADGAAPQYVLLGGTAAIAAAAARDLSAWLGAGGQAVSALSDLSKALLPTLSCAAAAAGAYSSAAARYAACTLFIDLLITAAQRLLLPLNCAFAALSAANCAMGNGALAGAARLVKWLCTMLLTALVLCFTGYLGLTGLISGAADAVTLRLTKTAVSTALPIVGGILTDAASSVMAGAAVVRNAAGVFGAVCTLCVCLGPFAALGVRYLLYKAAAAVSSALGAGRLSGFIADLGAAFAIEMAVVGAGGVMLLISVAACVKTVTAA